MKNLFTKILLLSFVVFASCTKNYNYNYEIENVIVTLDAQKLVTKVIKSPMLLASTTPLPDQEYSHIFPSEFKAYFISKETKGQYQQNQVVKVIDVTEGGNTITIPALDYKVIVTNYTLTNTNNLLNQNKEQLPKTSKVLYLYGDNNINYSTTTTGTVEVKNDYASLQVFKNEVTPESIFQTNQVFLKTPNWYVVYLRNQNGGENISTNVQIPVKKLNGQVDNYNSSQAFPVLTANQVHKIIFTNDVGDGEGGNLNVVIQEDILKEEVQKTITIN